MATGFRNALNNHRIYQINKTKKGKAMKPETRGRKKGYSPGNTRTITHKIGEWSWNTETLHARIQSGEPDECWTWTGSKNDMGNLFGAFKNDKHQMTQANRLIQMELLNEPIDGHSVRMKCKNKHCCNPSHFDLVNNRAPRTNTTQKIQQALKQEPWRPEPKVVPAVDTEQTYKLSISEHRFNDLDITVRMKLRELAADYASNAGINWEFEYRWMTMSKESLMLAKLKYATEIHNLTVSKL